MQYVFQSCRFLCSRPSIRRLDFARAISIAMAIEWFMFRSDFDLWYSLSPCWGVVLFCFGQNNVWELIYFIFKIRNVISSSTWIIDSGLAFSRFKRGGNRDRDLPWDTAELIWGLVLKFYSDFVSGKKNKNYSIY